MANSINDKSGILLDTPFKLVSQQPLDVRYVLTTAQRESLAADGGCYSGLEVWDSDENKKYRAVPTADGFEWKEMGLTGPEGPEGPIGPMGPAGPVGPRGPGGLTTTDATTLQSHPASDFLLKTGGTMTGAVHFEPNGDGQTIVFDNRNANINLNEEGQSKTLVGFLNDKFTINHHTIPLLIRGNGTEIRSYKQGDIPGTILMSADNDITIRSGGVIKFDCPGNSDFVFEGKSASQDYSVIKSGTTDRVLFLQPNKSGYINIGDVPKATVAQDKSARLIVQDTIKIKTDDTHHTKFTPTTIIKTNNNNISTFIIPDLSQDEKTAMPDGSALATQYWVNQRVSSAVQFLGTITDATKLGKDATLTEPIYVDINPGDFYRAGQAFGTVKAGDLLICKITRTAAESQTTQPTLNDFDVVAQDTDTNTAHTHTAGDGLVITGAGGTSGNVEYAVDFTKVAKKSDIPKIPEPPTIGNGQFTVSGTNGLTGSGSMTANQATDTNATLSIDFDVVAKKSDIPTIPPIPTVNNGKFTVTGTDGLKGTGFGTANQSNDTTATLSIDFDVVARKSDIPTIPEVPTVNNGTFTVSGGNGLTGTGSMTANQSGNTSATLNVGEGTGITVEADNVSVKDYDNLLTAQGSSLKTENGTTIILDCGGAPI